MKRLNQTPQVEVDPELIANIVCKRTQKELKDTISNEKQLENYNKQSQLLLTTDKGFINDLMTQEEIMENVDISTKTKKMDIALKYGPYAIDFTRDGRYLCVGGVKGQLAMLDWKSKDLKFDINVRERIRTVKYLNRENKIAVSQLDYTYIYDNEGKELHCIRQIFRASHLEYLPYHSLMVAGTEKGFLHYLDVTTGNIITNIKTHSGSVNMMCQNKANAIICTGHTSGTVSMWSPNEIAPVMKMLCHESPLRNVVIDNSGSYLVTSGQDRKMKVWDLRMTNEQLSDIRLQDSPTSLDFSQTGLLAVGIRSNVHILKDVNQGCKSMTVNSDNMSLTDALSNSISKIAPSKNIRPLLSHSYYGSTVHMIQFCPFEDILGCGLSTGFSTMFTPGSGEPNFDAFESNPYADVNFRKEDEVKKLLEKIPAELISLTANVATVHRPSIMEEWETEKSKMFDVNKIAIVKKKRSNRSKPKPANMKQVKTKNNLYYERLKLQGDLYKCENTTYKVKKPLSKAPINSVLDNLIYKQT